MPEIKKIGCIEWFGNTGSWSGCQQRDQNSRLRVAPTGRWVDGSLCFFYSYIKTLHPRRVKIYTFAPLLWAFLLMVSGNIASAADNEKGFSQNVTASIKQSLMEIGSSFFAHIPYLAAGLVILVLTWASSKIASRLLARVLKRTRMRSSLRELADRFIVISVWVVGILLAAMIVFPGLTPAKTLGAMGIASIAVGFAFKDIFENFFAGVLLLWRFPFESGDFIECQGVTGKVEQILVRMTQIRRPSGELVVMPNSTLFKNPVEVLTDRKNRRTSIITGVAYGENVADAVTVIDRAVKNCETVDQNKDVQIFPQAFGASSIDIEVAWWTGSTPLAVRRSRGEVVTVIKAALDDAGIEIPFPYRTLTFKESLQVMGLQDRLENQ